MTTSSISSLIDPTKAGGAYKLKASINGDGNGVDVTTTTVTSGADKAPAATRKSDMDKSDFLLLLVTQLRYQDPMSPMDNSQFSAQLAQFQQLESNQNIEKAVNKMSDAMGSSVDAQKGSSDAMSSASAITLIGKEVSVKRTEVAWQEGISGSTGIKVHLGSAPGATIELLDADGSVVKTLNTDEKNGDGSAFVAWDGTSDLGKPVKTGSYTIRFKGGDANPALYAFAQDVVQGVRFEGGKSYVRLSGGELDMKDLMDVSTPASATGYGSLSATSALGLLGKNVRVLDNTVQVQGVDNESMPITINMGNLTAAKVNILNQDGTVVATLDAQAKGDGSGTVQWNCRNDGDQSFVKPGTYLVQIAGQDKYPYLYSYLDGKVDGITNLGGDTQIKVGGRYVSAGQIIEVGMDAADGATSI